MLAECICWVPGTWRVGLLKNRVQASSLSIGVENSWCFSSYLPLFLSGVIFVFRCVNVYLSLFVTFVFVYIHTVNVSTQPCLCFSAVYIYVCTGTDGPGMHHPFCSRVLAWRPPSADGINHRPFWAWRSICQCWYVGNQWVSERQTHGVAMMMEITLMHMTELKTTGLISFSDYLWPSVWDVI